MIEIGADRPPQIWPDAPEHRAQIARYLGRIGEELETSWKVVYAGSVTTTASSASTTISDDAIQASDAVFMFPADATASAMVASVHATCSAGQVDMTHPSQPAQGVFHVAVVAL